MFITTINFYTRQRDKSDSETRTERISPSRAESCNDGINCTSLTYLHLSTSCRMLTAKDYRFKCCKSWRFIHRQDWSTNTQHRIIMIWKI